MLVWGSPCGVDRCVVVFLGLFWCWVFWCGAGGVVVGVRCCVAALAIFGCFILVLVCLCGCMLVRFLPVIRFVILVLAAPLVRWFFAFCGSRAILGLVVLALRRCRLCGFVSGCVVVPACAPLVLAGWFLHSIPKSTYTKWVLCP